MGINLKDSKRNHKQTLSARHDTGADNLIILVIVRLRLGQ